MANKYAGKKREALKKRYDKLKRIEKNNLPTGKRFKLDSLNDLRSAGVKDKVKK